MIVGDIPDAVDLLVVGGGPGGYVAAIRGAQLGRRVTLVDRDEWDGLGGACLHVGCIPSKSLIELGELVARTSGEGTPGLVATGVEVDLPAFQVRRRETSERLARGVAGLMCHHGVDVRTGDLRFTAPRRAVVVGEQGSTHLEFEDVVIATGSRPRELPEGPTVDGERVLDSTGLLALERVPATLCVVGGGYVGLELGTAFAKLGARVTVVEAADRLAGTLDDDVVRTLTDALRRLGVEVLVDSRVVDLGAGQAVVRSGDGEERKVAAELVGLAAGRRPNTDGLGLELLGVEPDAEGRLVVDAARAVRPKVAAIGDVTAGPALAHKATAEAAVAVEGLSGRRAAFSPAAVPIVMFTDPEVAATGLTAAAAEAQGVEVATGTFPLAALGRAATLGRRDGLVRLVADRADGTVLGAQIVGPHASELIAEATLAVEMGASIEDLALTVHAHPTLAEGLREAAEVALGRPTHVAARELPR